MTGSSATPVNPAFTIAEYHGSGMLRVRAISISCLTNQRLKSGPTTESGGDDIG